jgi:hypothetical protein
MNAKNQLTKIKTLLGLEVKLEIMKLENGVELEATSFEAGSEVFIVNEEDRVALPIGEYMLEDSRILVVIEEGIIAEIKEAEAEETPAEETPEVEVEVEAEAETATPKKVVESVTKEMFFSEIEALRNELAELKTSLSAEPVTEEVAEEVEVELSAEESKPLKHSPEAGVQKKELNLYAQKKANTTKDIVFGKIFK